MSVLRLWRPFNPSFGAAERRIIQTLGCDRNSGILRSAKLTLAPGGFPISFRARHIGATHAAFHNAGFCDRG
jgi:hypothetical protein